MIQKAVAGIGEMATHDQSEGLDWRETGVPVSRRFDDPYFSLQGGLEETRHVFLKGSGLPDRFTEGFRIAELGFGTGLNMLACLMSWASTGRSGRIRFTSFEAYPLSAAEMARALSAFPEIEDVARPFLAAWADGKRQIALPGLDLTVIEGDARETLPVWQDQADAWFLDGFSPAKNPELWSDALMAEVFSHTAPGGTFATYSAAGHVRRALSDAGFAVERIPGYATKRHMTRGRKPVA